MARYISAHLNPHGPGDDRPTASQIIEDEGLLGNLSGTTILITGCSSGLGVEAAKALYETGATLYLTARNLFKALTALGPGLCASSRVHLLKLDLESLASVRDCAAKLLAQTEQLDIFIANAGIMACPEGRTEDKFEKQLGTNHLSHFLLFNLIKPAMFASAIKGRKPRSVIVSSMAHRLAEIDFDNPFLENEYTPWRAYGQSKTANIWMANEIDRRESEHGIRAYIVHPGVIYTSLGRYLSDEEKEAMAANTELPRVLKSPQQGAAPIMWAAISKDLDGMGGKYVEDCQIAGVHDASTDGRYNPGHASWAFSPAKESKLWCLSSELVGL